MDRLNHLMTYGEAALEHAQGPVLNGVGQNHQWILEPALKHTGEMPIQLTKRIGSSADCLPPRARPPF